MEDDTLSMRPSNENAVGDVEQLYCGGDHGRGFFPEQPTAAILGFGYHAQPVFIISALSEETIHLSPTSVVE